GNSGKVGDAEPPAICPPAEVDLSLIRSPDKTERVIASSPNGNILSGLDIPVVPMPKITRIQRWSLSVLRGYDVARGQSSWGAAVSYSRGPLVGTAGALGPTAFVGIGLKF